MDQKKINSKRRGFLLGAGSAGAAGAVAVATAGASRQLEQQAAQPQPEKRDGYHVTQHVRAYYRTTLV